MKKAILAALVAALAAGDGVAQERITFTPTVETADNVQVDLRISETWSGSQLTAATADLCIGTDVDFSNGVVAVGDYDRALLQLKIDGAAATGTAVSDIAKRQATVQFARRPQLDGKVIFEGSITFNGKTYTIRREPRESMSLRIDAHYTKPNNKPIVFDDVVTPNAISVTLKYGTLGELVEAVRGVKARLDLSSSESDKCTNLRLGTQQIRMLTPPTESQALVARLRQLSFVVDAGWTSYYGAMLSAGVSGNGWVVNGVLNREKVSSEFSAAVAKHIDARLVSAGWDEKSGELKMKFERPSKLFPKSGLIESYEMVTLIAPDRFGPTDRALIWGPTIYGDISEAGLGPDLGVVPLQLYAGPQQGIVINIPETEMAKLVKGEGFDFNSGRWVK